jgi:beta-fructofuranosidase
MEFIAKPVQALICWTGAEHIIFRLRGSTAQETNLELELSLGELIFDRTLSGKISALQRNCLLESASQSQLIVRIFLDSILIEIFTDGGRNTMTNNIFSSPERTQLSISTVSGSACLGGLWPMG